MWEYSLAAGDEITIQSDDVDIEINADLELTVEKNPPNRGVPYGGDLRTQFGPVLKQLAKLDQQGVHFDIEVESQRNPSWTFGECIGEETAGGVWWLCSEVA